MEYTFKLLHLLALQKGGYPFSTDDLTLEEWVDLGLVKESLKDDLICPFMKKQ